MRNYRFFTNAFSTTSRGVDVVSTWTPLALRVHSEYMPWGYSGAYYYMRIGYDWGN